MSRCFPFPPPWYLRNSARRDALIESIKLRKDDIEKANKLREEKKERKREKKEKKERKQKGSTTSVSNDVAKKLKLIDQTEETKAYRQLQKVEDCENELHERNGITEEHEQPASCHDPCSSDSSQSSKRKRDTSFPPGHDHASACQLQHLKKVETKQSSGNVARLTQLTKSDGQLQCIKKGETKQFPIDTLVTNKKVDKESQRIASLYDSLFQIKIPQPYELDSADQDWLFSSELTKIMPVSKKLKIDSDAFQCSKSVWPPRAHNMFLRSRYMCCHTLFHFDSLVGKRVAFILIHIDVIFDFEVRLQMYYQNVHGDVA